MSKSNKTVETIETVEPTKSCFKFIANTVVGGVLHLKDSCIKLDPNDLGDYAAYVYECHGSKESKKGPCVKC